MDAVDLPHLEGFVFRRNNDDPVSQVHLASRPAEYVICYTGDCGVELGRYVEYSHRCVFSTSKMVPSFSRTGVYSWLKLRKKLFWRASTDPRSRSKRR